jgi:hypothetical protein
VANGEIRFLYQMPGLRRDNSVVLRGLRGHFHHAIRLSFDVLFARFCGCQIHKCFASSGFDSATELKHGTGSSQIKK